MFRRSLFWILLVLASLSAILFTLKFFSRAFPIISIDLRMNRSAALERSRELAIQYNWGPTDFRQAADFDVDEDVQNFVELEGGGKDAFSRMIKEGIFSPYTWAVRLFKEGDETETLVEFTPAGTPFGFKETLPEKQPGKKLPTRAARSVAEIAASQFCQIPFEKYDLVEESDELKVGGRQEHYFTYERREKKVGEGTYRLRLAVSGDRLTEVTHYIKIPEAYFRRFKQMRSANDTLAASADIVTGVLYILGGCIIGLFLLLRARWVVWKPALILALLVGAFQAFSDINRLPLEWMNYDTAITYGGFILDHVLSIIYGFFETVLLLGLTFIAAESLTRKAFPEHIQLWKVWAKEAGGSIQVFGRTVGGYLLVSLFCAFQVALYYITTKFPHWWSPSDTLVEPNIFASYFPWFSSFATAMHAGIWEECLFRAVPIACGAIIGQRFGNRKKGIMIALIGQAVIFGAAHANYPNQPFYARLVELLIPAFGFGLLYVTFGLLPGIILHFTFDATWMSLPFFISSAPGVWIDRALIIIFVLIPLWAVFVRRFAVGAWLNIPYMFRNAEWRPELPDDEPVTTERSEERMMMAPTVIKTIFAVGLFGAILWLAAGRFKSDVPSLEVSRTSAVSISRKALLKQGIALDPPWRALTIISSEQGDDERFVWQKGGISAYRALIDKEYLQPPLWMVRFVRFEGDIVDRAEERRIVVAEKGKVIAFSHNIPENAKGASLTIDEARALAEKAIITKYFIDIKKLLPVSASPSKLPGRVNWEFIYQNPGDFTLSEGQARVTVDIDGDEVTRIFKSVYVPDEWKRRERKRLHVLEIMQSSSGIVTMALFVAGFTTALVGWSRRTFSRPLFIKAFAFLFLLRLAGTANNWPGVVSHFSTSEPLKNQLLVTLGIAFAGALFVSLNIALINGFIESWKSNESSHNKTLHVLLGLSAGICASGLLAAAARVAPQYVPICPHFDSLNTYSPVAASLITGVSEFCSRATLFLFFFAIIGRLSSGGNGKKILFLVITLFFGMSLAASGPVDSLISLASTGIVFSLLMIFGYLFVFRYALSLVPLAVAGMFCLSLIKQAIFNAYPNAAAGFLVAAIAVFLLSIYWYYLLDKRSADNHSKEVI